jgi:hypothetical protein
MIRLNHTKLWLALAAAFLFCAPVDAQNAQGRVTFSSATVTVRAAIQTIEGQTGKMFAYENNLLDLSSRVTFSAPSLPLEEALTQMLSSKGLTYMFHGRYIIIPPDFKSTVDRQVAANRTSDLYRQTQANSMSADPMSRPMVETAAPRPVTRRVAVERTLAPVTGSDYVGLDNYLPSGDYLPSIAVKTNLLYGLGTLSPNLALELGLAERSSLNVSAGYNGWHRKGTVESNKKLINRVIRAEYRYWLCERFNGHFLSAGLFWNRFNVGGYNIPFAGFKKENRYEGDAIGFGVNYGYNLPLAKRLGAEFSLGVGVAPMKAGVYDCAMCSAKKETLNKTYFGPTHLSISFVYLIK